jgi:hypothetical protein
VSANFCFFHSRRLGKPPVSSTINAKILSAIVDAIHSAWARIPTFDYVKSQPFSPAHWHDEDELSVKLMEILNEDLDSSTTGPFRKEILQSVTRDSKQSTADAKSFDQMPDLTFRMVHCAAGEERDESALFVEAKLVDSDKGCRQYVVEGLHRFVSGRYAPRVTFGMMLGYGATAFHQVDVHLTEYFTNARAKPAKACRSTVLPSGIHASCHTTRHKRRKPCPEDFRALHVWVTRPV